MVEIVFLCGLGKSVVALAQLSWRPVCGCFCSQLSELNIKEVVQLQSLIFNFLHYYFDEKLLDRSNEKWCRVRLTRVFFDNLIINYNQKFLIKYKSVNLKIFPVVYFCSDTPVIASSQ